MAMDKTELDLVKKICKIAQRRYDASMEPLHPCELPGERLDMDWAVVRGYAQTLLDLNGEG